VDRGVANYTQAIDNKHAATGGLLTTQQAYCLAFAPAGFRENRFPGFEKIV